MITIEIPGVGNRTFSHLVLDVNGTLSVDGELIAGVAERCRRLHDVLQVRLLTANTRGTAAQLGDMLAAEWSQVVAGSEAEQKRDYVEALGAAGVVAIGNGNNDAAMLDAAGLGIAVLGAEGTSTRALLAADIVAKDILVALDLLLDPVRLIATLRC